MGGECYRYLKLKPHSITLEEEEVYRNLLPIMIELVQVWFSEQVATDWIIAFGGANAVELQVNPASDPDHRFPNVVVLPVNLNDTLNIGWQHHHYGSILDPKYEIANDIMDTLLNSDLKSSLLEDKEDNIKSDLYLDDYSDDDNERYQSKGTCHYLNNIPDDDWSPNGMYGGYNDWETYRDANGLDD